MNADRSLQICVVGCGECGSRIAAFFDKIPSFLEHRTWQWYPVRCAAIDTNPSIQKQLPRPPWNWHEMEDIHIIPIAKPDILLQRIFGTVSENERVKEYFGEKSGARGFSFISGAGGFPFMGTLAAEEALLKEGPLKTDFQEAFIKRGFTQGALIVANSLSGGTGTGFGPVIPEFMSSFWKPRITFSLSIVPQITLFESKELKNQIYPGNILYGLYRLSQSKIVDAVILADNDILSKEYGCKGNPDYNSCLHEILFSILLATTGEYECPSFGKTLDLADMGRTLRSYRGLGLPELCTLSSISKKPPHWLLLKLRSRRSRAIYITEWLHSLIDSVMVKNQIKTTVGLVDNNVQGAVAVLSGPKKFFDDVLGGYEEYFNTLESYAKQKISNNLRLSFIQFPHTKKVCLSIILSGVTSPKLEKVYKDAIPSMEQKQQGTLMDRIRQLNPNTVENVMVGEIKEHLRKEIPGFEG